MDDFKSKNANETLKKNIDECIDESYRVADIDSRVKERLISLILLVLFNNVLTDGFYLIVCK